MSTPQVPHLFATVSGDIPASQLDDNNNYLLGLIGNTWDLVAYFGIPADGSDQTTALNNAFAAAKAAGRNLTAPAGVFGHNGNLTLDSVVLTGAGPQTEFRATATPVAGVVLAGFYLTGNNPGLRNCKVTSPNATARTPNNDGNAVTVQNATNYLLENVQAIGASAVGFFKTGCTGGIERGCSTTGSQADGNHNTGGSSKITIWGHTSTNTGDDGIAIVSYQKDNALCTDIKIIGCSVFNGTTRGITVVGGQRVQIVACNTNTTQYPGVYISSEASYNTYGCEDILVDGCLVENACQSTSTSGGGDGALTAIGQTGGGTAMAGGQTIALDTHDVLFVNNVIRGSGTRMRAAIWIGPGSTRAMAKNNQIANLRRVGSGLIPDAISLDGTDSSADGNTAYNIGGSLISTIGGCFGKIRDFNNRGRLLCQDVTGTTYARNFVGTPNAVLHSKGGSQHSDGLSALIPFTSTYDPSAFVVEDLWQDDVQVPGNLPSKAVTIAFTGSSLTLPAKANTVYINGGFANSVNTLSTASHDAGDIVSLYITDAVNTNQYNLNPGSGFVSDLGAWNAFTGDVLIIQLLNGVWRELRRVFQDGRISLHPVHTASAPTVGGGYDMYAFYDGNDGLPIPALRRVDNGQYDRYVMGVPIRTTNSTVGFLNGLTLANYAGHIAFDPKGLKVGETAGNGTGVLVYCDGASWRRCSDDTLLAE